MLFCIRCWIYSFETSNLFFSEYTVCLLRHFFICLHLKHVSLGFNMHRHLYFISPTTYPMNSIFSELLCIYKIHVFDETFFLLAIVTIITKKMSFSYFHGNLRQGKIFSSSYARYNLDYP